MPSIAENLPGSIAACVDNGKRLLEDAKFMLEWERSPTAFALAVLAQEEFVKAFVLHLVADEALPWLPEIRQSIARHQCKHLLAIVLEWLPNFDEVNERFKQEMARRKEKHRLPDPIEEDLHFPADVAAALNIYHHEEIEPLRTFGDPRRDDDWKTGYPRKIADGSLDRKKQSALYVDITKTGEIGRHPGLITPEESSAAIERAERLSESLVTCSDEYFRLKEVLPLIFANLNKEGRDRQQ